MVRMNTCLVDVLREYKRVTGLPVQLLLDKAVKFWLGTQGEPFLQGWGVPQKEIDRISQMRYDKPEKKRSSSPAAKKALA